MPDLRSQVISRASSTEEDHRGEIYRDLLLECNLMIFHRVDCECSTYWAQNGNMIIEQIIEKCEIEHRDALEMLADFARSVHAKHLHDACLYT